MKFVKSLVPLFGLLLATNGPARAQSTVAWDSSGNGLLQGVYNYRQVLWLIGDNSGNLGRAVSFSGTITFDGSGAYTLSASVMDSNANQVQSLNKTGTYSVAASGQGFLSSPVNQTGTVFGMVSQGIFVGSSTEDAINDLFIAAPAGSPAPTDSVFNGTYWVASMNLPNAGINFARDALFQINPDGQGNLGTLNATGFIGGGTATTQTINGARYAFSNGVATVTYGGTLSTQNLLAGSTTLYMSPDGNFIFGGSPTGWDMFVGVRALPGDAAPDLLKGLYYHAGVDVNETTLAQGFATMHTYYGAFNANYSPDGGVLYGHQRLLSGFDQNPYDYTYADAYTIATDGTYPDFLGFRNIIGAGGAIKIGFGQQGGPGINVGLKAPDFSGTGVFLSPTGVVNGASFAPFSVGVSRGELISLSGTNLANDTASDGTFPTTLAGVQVLINNRPAPIQSVSPKLITVLVPFATVESIAQIQVVNNSAQSNTVTAFLNITTPGVYTVSGTGVGYADAVHSDSSQVTAANPAKPGETVTVHVTGLGDVNPANPDAAPGPSNPPSAATASLAAYIDGQQATVGFAGLTPGTAGLYQMNITVPAKAASGDLFLDVSGPDSYTTQVQLPVASGSQSPAEMQVRTKDQARPQTPRARPDRRPQGAGQTRRIAPLGKAGVE